MSKTIQTIAIIGAGFSGTLAAVHLLKAQTALRLRIVLTDSHEAGRGLAYGTTEPKHVLNVPAGGMSAFDDEPEDFVRYLSHRFGTASPNEFAARSVYGDYLQKTLNEAVANKAENIEFVSLRSRVIDVREVDIDKTASKKIATRYDIVSSNGSTLSADKIILALGNAKPATPRLNENESPINSARYIDDPWSENLLERVDQKRPVLLIGTGLTAVDVVLKLAVKQFKPKIYAVSRHGLQPTAHRGLSGKAPSIDLPSLRASERFALRRVMRVLRAQATLAVSEGRDWRDVIATVRSNLPQLWQQLDAAERKRLLRHVSVYWDVHRHRLAPSVAAAMHDAIVSKHLVIDAARISSWSDRGDYIDVGLLPRGQSVQTRLRVGTVINCTGPGTKLATLDDDLIASLLHRGLLRADAHGLGIEVADNYATTSAGPSANSLFYVGPWLKAKFWEATAVPELRAHAKRAVDNVLASFNGV